MKVYAKVQGSGQREFELAIAATVKDLKAAMGLGSNYTGKFISQEPAGDNDELTEDDFVVFTANVKGGMAA